MEYLTVKRQMSNQQQTEIMTQKGAHSTGRMDKVMDGGMDGKLSSKIEVKDVP